jgi:predicted regulator of Ras-like GTPase activity (Roadblock/LC7/MglB family)
MDAQLTSLIVSEEELKNIDECLERMQTELNATSILVLDQAGQVIASRSMRSKTQWTTVGALLSGTFYGSRELARALQESEFKTLYQQGPRESVYAELIGEKWILATIFRKQTLLGMVRVMSRRIVGDLEQVLERVKKSNQVNGKWFNNGNLNDFETTFESLFKEEPFKPLG